MLLLFVADFAELTQLRSSTPVLLRVFVIHFCKFQSNLPKVCQDFANLLL